MIRFIPLHKISSTDDYLGFSLGNEFFIVKMVADGVYATRTNFTYWSTIDKAAYDEAIDNPSVLTYSEIVEAQIDLSFIFNLV